MKTTFKIKMNTTDKLHTNPLDHLMAVFSSSCRFAFKRLLEGKKTNDINKIIQHKFLLNKRFSEDAVLKAKTIIDSQKELLPLRLEDVQVKIEKTQKKLDEYQTGKKKPKKVDLETCLKGLTVRLKKLTEKEKELSTHIEEGTIPTIIFGGKKNFYERMKGNLSKEEWRDLRSNALYSRGDRSKKGNLNIRLGYDESNDQFYVEIANPLLMKEGQKNAPRLVFPVHVPHKYLGKVLNLIMPNEDNYIPYTVEIKRRKGEYTLHVSYEEETYGEELKGKETFRSDKIAGVDMNIDRLAVSILSKEGNLLKTKVFYCHELEYVSSNRRENIIGETVKRMFDWLLSEGVGGIVLEDIKLKQNHGTDKRFNRLVHNFAKKKLTQAIVSNALRLGFQYKKVNPAYTSVIGRFKYMKKYGLSVHESASFVIGRRGLGYEEKLSKENISMLKEKVKPHLIGLLGSMEESYKQTKSGKKKRQYLGMMLKKINHFKDEHSWSLWNIFHKTCWLKQFEPQLKDL